MQLKIGSCYELIDSELIRFYRSKQSFRSIWDLVADPTEQICFSNNQICLVLDQYFISKYDLVNCLVFLIDDKTLFHYHEPNSYIAKNIKTHFREIC